MIIGISDKVRLVTFFSLSVNWAVGELENSVIWASGNLVSVK